MRYVLCLYNNVVAVIDFKEDKIIDVESYNNALLPFGSYKTINGKFIFTPVTFKAWWNNRCIPDTRKNLRRLLQKITCVSVTELVLSNLGVSLTDCYWLKPMNKEFNNVTWETVNLYTNVFNVNAGFQKQYYYKTINDISPDTTLNGNLPKFWSVCDNGIYLLKSCNSKYQRVANEVFATLLHRKQGKIAMRDYVQYTATKYKDEIYSSCPNVCTIDISMTSARDLLHECKVMDNQIEIYNLVAKLNQYGVTNDRIQTFLDYMILSDFVLSNCDRHMNNIGILYYAQNKQIIGFAPLYDFGDSMFYEYKDVPEGNILLNMKTTSFYKYEIDMLKLVQNPNAIVIENLPDRNEFYSIYSTVIKDKVRIDELYKGYCRKISLLHEFQQGVHIWHRRHSLKS